MQIIHRPGGEESPERVIEKNQQGLQPMLESLPGWGREASERDDEFWRHQRRSVWARISAAENRSARRAPVLAWALVGAMMAVAGWLVERPMVVPLREAYDPDHELLMEVERMVQIDGPLALEPAALLAQEMVQDMPSRDYPNRKKEPRNEN
jgi:hypothetical protein